jgi:hypothetical protein
MAPSHGSLERLVCRRKECRPPGSSQTSASPPPKELDPRTLSKISAALQGFIASGGDANGGERGDRRPLLSPRLAGRPCPRCGSTSLVCEEKKADERISAPKGVGSRVPRGFGLNHAVFGDQEGRRGTMIVPHPKLSARAMPPLWQYFLG